MSPDRRRILVVTRDARFAEAASAALHGACDLVGVRMRAPRPGLAAGEADLVLTSGADIVALARRSRRAAVALANGAPAVVAALRPGDAVQTIAAAPPQQRLAFLASDPQRFAAALDLALEGLLVAPHGVLGRLRSGALRRDKVRLLTGLELKVLDCLAAGLPNRDVARRLDLSEARVKSAVRSAIAKLGMRNRTEAGLFAAREAAGPAR